MINDNGSECKVSVDGTDFRVQQFQPYDEKWKSHKFEAPRLRYEVGVAIQTGYIVWLNGPFKAGEFNDIMIFRQALKGMLKNGERVEADKGYLGEHAHIDVPNDMLGLDPDQKRRKTIVRYRHETCNKRFKQWNCLKQVFRHQIHKHVEVFNAVAVLTQLSIENGWPLFQVEYKTKNYPTYN